MTTLTIVQARMGSTRLPGKVMAEIGGQPVLRHVLGRVVQACISPIVVATSARGSDQPIADLCDELAIPCYRSSEHDVLNRFYRAAKHHGADQPDDTIVRVTADCPLLCPELLRATVDLHEAVGADYTGVQGAPEGFGQEAIRFAALEQAWQEARTPSDREHVIPFIQDDPDRFRVAYVEAPDFMFRGQRLRFTVDTQEDVDLLNILYGVTCGRLFQMGSRQILDAVRSDTAAYALASRIP